MADISVEWINVQIVLSAADPNYKNTLALGSGVKASLTTGDGGKTWNVGTISLPQFTFWVLSQAELPSYAWIHGITSRVEVISWCHVLV